MRLFYAPRGKKLFCGFGLFAALLLSPAAIPTTAAMDRTEFSKLLRAIPPNGPGEEYGNVILRPPKGEGTLPPAVFPHWRHREAFTCRVCHLELKFSMFRGETVITRAKNLGGKYCGACHNGTRAFSVQTSPQRHCHRCHLSDQDRKAMSERFHSFAGGMPSSDFGNGIDWAKAFNENDIEPVDGLSSRRQDGMSLPEKLRKPLELGTSAPRSGVLFSHQEHFAEMDCSNCHPIIFDIQKKGTEFFSMDKNIFGWFCGTCHMRVAFPMNDCHRCHPAMRNVSGF